MGNKDLKLCETTKIMSRFKPSFTLGAWSSWLWVGACQRFVYHPESAEIHSFKICRELELDRILLPLTVKWPTVMKMRNVIQLPFRSTILESRNSTHPNWCYCSLSGHQILFLSTRSCVRHPHLASTTNSCCSTFTKIEKIVHVSQQGKPFVYWS